MAARAAARPIDADTPLMEASYYNHLAIVRRLLAAGADPALRAKDGGTAADAAEQQGHAAVLKLLRKHARTPAAAAASPAASSASDGSAVDAPAAPADPMVLPAGGVAMEPWLRCGGHGDARNADGQTLLGCAGFPGSGAGGAGAGGGARGVGGRRDGRERE